MGAAASGSRADVQFIVFAAIMLHKVKGCAENFCKGNKIAKKKKKGRLCRSYCADKWRQSLFAYTTENNNKISYGNSMPCLDFGFF